MTDLDPLVSALPIGSVLLDSPAMEPYRFDRSGGTDVGIPLAVVRPRTTEEVQAVVRFAAEHGIPVVPRGAGTGLSGGSSAVDGCIVVSTELMRDIVVDPITHIIRTQPGVLNSEVKAAAREHGLWYPPDPASYEICSIGGNIATNAGGLCCVKYGVTTDYVLGLEVVLADGSAVVLGGPRLKDVAGLPLTKLFVGSEGVLGIVTSIVLRLIPAQRPPSTLVATFATLADATSSVLEMTRQLRPSMLEFMDNATINAVEDMMQLGLDRSAAAMLVVQSDEPAGHAAVELAAIEAVCVEHSATSVAVTDDPDEGDAFVVARRNAIPAVELGGPILLGDVGVPIPLLGHLVEGIARISEEHGVVIAVIAHAGDGNTHPLVVLDPDDPEQLERANDAYARVTELAIALGGTITGEHGVGRTKRPWLAAQVGDDVVALGRRIKDALDPLGIMNPGAGV